MAIRRIIDTRFWKDEKVVSEYTPEDKYFFLYLLTNPQTTLLGIYKFVPKIAAFEMGYSIEAVITLIERFEKKYKVIRYNKETSEMAVRNYLKYGIVAGGKPVYDRLVSEAKEVKDKSLIAYIKESIFESDELNYTARQFLETIDDEKPEYQNKPPEPPVYGDGNGNGNGYGVTSPLRGRNVDVTSPQSKKPVKHKHGEYQNVLLTDDELEKLKTEFTDWAERIERLSEYIESKGAKYKSHLATIRSWARKDNPNGLNNGKPADDGGIYDPVTGLTTMPNGCRVLRL